MNHKKFVLLFFSLCLNVWAAKSLVDGLAATVGTELIRVQDCYFSESLQRLIEGKKNESEVFEYPNSAALGKIVQRLIFEEMVFAELKSFNFEEVDRQRAVQQGAEIKKRVGAPLWEKFLKAYSKSEKEVVDEIWKNLKVEKFVQKRVETLTPIITQAEVERYFQQNEEEFKPEDREKLKPNVTLILKKQRVEKGLEEWVRSLKQKYRVTNHLDG